MSQTQKQTALKSFHNDNAIKEKYLSRVRIHAAADNLIRGTGWDGKKGCAVGCTLENYDHARYETELGIPEWLARVEDTIFEGMSREKSRTWPEEFLKSIPVGVDLEQIKSQFIILVLKSNLENFDHEKFPDVKKAIEGSIALWQRADIGSESWASAARSAESAAASAARSAESAAESAAASAARSAESAARSAESAARSAESAAESAAWSAKYDYFADQLLEMLRGAK